MNIEKELQKIEAKVSKLLKQGYDKEILQTVNRIEAKLDTESMPEEFQKILKDIKQTPLDEPKIYEMSKMIVEGELSIIDIVLMFLSEDDIDKYSIEEVSYFAGKILRKVSSLKDDNGIFKTTPNLSKWQPPKPSQIKKYENFNKKISKANEDEVMDIVKEYDEFLLDCCKVEKDGLIEWEINLAKEQTKEVFQGYLTSFLGKR